MKQSILPPASHLAVLVLFSSVAFLAGRITGTSPAADTAKNAADARGSSTSGSPQRTLESPTPDKTFLPVSTPAVLNPDNAQARTFEVLSMPDRVERLRQLCELLRSASRENWRSILDAYMRVATTTGRRNRDELSLILERVGAVAGSEAIQEALSSEKSHERKRVPELLTGWAYADPKAAMAWVAAQPEEQQAALIPPLINGMGMSEPVSALSVVSNDLADIRDSLVPQVVEGVIKHGGFDALEDLLSKLTGSTSIVPPVQGAVFWEASVRQVEAARLRGEPVAILDWAEPYVTGNFPGPASMKEIVSCAAKADAAATIRWMVERHGKLTPEQEAVAFPIIAREMLAQDPQKLAEWVSANPEHPRRDSVAQAAAQQMLKDGRLEDARQWVEKIGDAANRQSVKQKILEAEQKAGNTAPAP